jgi:hypothetical protein
MQTITNGVPMRVSCNYYSLPIEQIEQKIDKKMKQLPEEIKEEEVIEAANKIIEKANNSMIEDDPGFLNFMFLVNQTFKA